MRSATSVVPTFAYDGAAGINDYRANGWVYISA
jgi:hypothetical protein